MKTALTYGTASFAVAVSLMGTAHAAEADAIEAIVEVVDEVAEDQAANDDESSAERDLVGPVAQDRFVLVQEPQLVPFQLEAFESAIVPSTSTTGIAAIDQGINIAPVTGNVTVPAPTTLAPKTSSLEGTVTLRGVDPFYGDIDPFYGNINPFYGDIDAFWGDINPFYGDINPFYGNIDAFYGDINPFYGDITAFWGDINPFYGDIVAFETNLSGLSTFWQSHFVQIDEVEARFNAISHTSTGAIVRDGSPSRMMTALNAMIEEGRTKFGAAYTQRTGQSFDVLVDEVFAKYGADPSNRATVEILTKRDRALLYLDWHDALMQNSGVDIVDHWMAAINWNPAITEIQGAGHDTIIGIIDGSFAADADLGDNVVHSGGFFNEVGGHGAGVASLIAGAHDGEGVMGIAPDVKIATYNPFNPNGSSNWGSVKAGIQELQNLKLHGYNDTGKVSIINLSLGEKGTVLSQSMANLLSDKNLAQYVNDTVYVIAAGNEGLTQTQNLNWDFQVDPTFILVGAIDPAGDIAAFSNRPGPACLVSKGQCQSGNELFMRTVVAPGMLLAAADGHGGVTRVSGTSFAAPLVSGAISLLHDRWTWLAEHPEASAEIIFRSAQDLGAPGPDEVYGWGLLDVAASQSPLDFGSLQLTMYQRLGANSSWSPVNLSAQTVLAMGIPSWWETSDVFFTGFEQVGDTYRDFSIPASAFTLGRTTDVLGRGEERFQDFVNKRFAKWINSGGTDTNGDGRVGFTELRSNNSELNGEWSLRYDAMAPQYAQDGSVRMVHSAATITEPSGRASFTFGHGQGGMALSGNRFGVVSDHDPFTGGVNPVLGLASGETFMQMGYKLAPNTKVSVGYSENRDEWDEFNNSNPEEALIRQALGDRPAQAFTLDIEQRVSDRVSLNAQYTRLNEVNALLGTQTAAKSLLGGGSQTEAMTVSATIDAGNGFTFDLSATGARTETARDQLFTNAGAVWSTAGQISATKRGIFGGNDTLRISVAQPLQVEDGSLQVVSDQVINRETGETGAVTQTFGIETRRRITTEAVYAMPLTQSSEFGVFSRYVSAGDTFNEAGLVVGGNFSIRF
ncbi:MAG: S8 family serine peptidase [Pseudomonadota bacterium]